MRYGSAALGGIVASLIGAAIWAAIGYFANAEVGWIAWGIGFMAGAGVAYMSGDSTDGATGVIAATCAIGGVLIGKYLVIHFLVNQAFQENLVEINDEHLVAQMAWTVAEERTAEGKSITPDGKKKTVDEVDEVSELLPEIRTEARKRWDALSADEQQQQIAEQQAEMDNLIGGFVGEAKNEGFMKSFGMFDLLWFFLAAATAFRIGSGGSND